MKKDILITIPLEALIEQLFGKDEEPRFYVPIQPTIAEVLEYHIKHSKLELLFKIQYSTFAEISRFTEYKEEPLEYPRLWVYKDWSDSNENWYKKKAISEKERKENELLKLNIKIVAKAYRTFVGSDSVEQSEAKAYALLKGNKMASIQAMGIELSKLHK